MTTTILSIFLAVIAVANVGAIFYFERHRLGFSWDIYSRIRWHMLPMTILTIIVTIATAIALYRIPWLQYGWASLIYGGKGNNVLIGPMLEASRSSFEWVRLLPIVFLVALFVVVPFMAHVEEQLFREDVTEWRRIIPRSLVFGMMHCLVGIPLAAGLALSIAGLYFGWRYKQAYEARVAKIGRVHWEHALDGISAARTEAVLVSTTYHALWNGLLVWIMLLGSIVMALR